MKKVYTAPVLHVVVLDVTDILTASVDNDERLWQPHAGYDSSWDKYLNVN